MAQKTIVHLTDDIDGGDANQSITFTYQNKKYSLDLSDKNVADLEEMLTPYMAAATKAGRVTANAGARAGRPARPSKPSRGSDVDPKAVRAWAESNGLEVNKRGRLSSDIIIKFQEAQAH